MEVLHHQFVKKSFNGFGVDIQGDYPVGTTGFEEIPDHLSGNGFSILPLILSGVGELRDYRGDTGYIAVIDRLDGGCHSEDIVIDRILMGDFLLRKVRLIEELDDIDIPTPKTLFDHDLYLSIGEPYFIDIYYSNPSIDTDLSVNFLHMPTDAFPEFQSGIEGDDLHLTVGFG